MGTESDTLTLCTTLHKDIVNEASCASESKAEKYADYSAKTLEIVIKLEACSDAFKRIECYGVADYYAKSADYLRRARHRLHSRHFSAGGTRSLNNE
jgi:hypothetical protein